MFLWCNYPVASIVILYQIVDVTDRKTYESQLLNLAHHDELTGLYNRAKLYEMFDCFCWRANEPSSVLLCYLLTWITLSR